MVELPLDVRYTIIVDHFQHDKQTLLSLIFVSRSISEVALDILWGMKPLHSLQFFYSVINSPSPSCTPGGCILSQSGGDTEESDWSLDEPSLVSRHLVSFTSFDSLIT